MTNRNHQVGGLSPELLPVLLDYNPATGSFIWLRRPLEMFATENAAKTWNTRFTGRDAFVGKNNHGYRHGAIFGKTLLAHRVAWAITHCQWPDGEVDHINGQRDDNRIENLRVVNRSENARNQSVPSTSKSGVVGVCLCRRTMKWQAQIWLNGGSRHLGRFYSFDDAVRARRDAEERHGFHPNHGRKS